MYALLATDRRDKQTDGQPQHIKLQARLASCALIMETSN